MSEISGHVDLFTNFPTISIELLNESDQRFETSVIVDTGYNGEVILPETKIQNMDLGYEGLMSGELATGEIVEVALFECRLKWFDEIREITVGSTGSDIPLLGTTLLSDCDLQISFKDGSVRINRKV